MTLRWTNPDLATRQITSGRPRRGTRAKVTMAEHQEARAAMVEATKASGVTFHDIGTLTPEQIEQMEIRVGFTPEQEETLNRAYDETETTPPVLPPLFTNVDATPHTHDDCAATILEWVGGIDPSWKERLQVMQDERQLTPMQALGACVAYVLENSLQMVVVTNDAFEPNTFRRGDKMVCQNPECGQEFRPAYPLQPYCSNTCADHHRDSIRLDRTGGANTATQ